MKFLEFPLIGNGCLVVIGSLICFILNISWRRLAEAILILLLITPSIFLDWLHFFIMKFTIKSEWICFCSLWNRWRELWCDELALFLRSKGLLLWWLKEICSRDAFSHESVWIYYSLVFINLLNLLLARLVFRK